jgi:Uncharacterized protein conserved in bacteria (DUF2263)
LNVKIQWTEENTRYYGPDAGEGGEILESEFIKINEEGGDEGKEEDERNGDSSTGTEEEANRDNASYRNATPKDQTRVQSTVPPDPPKKATFGHTRTSIYIGEYSTLVGARKVHLALARNTNPSVNKKIGVLNFASAKKPGGEFVNGYQAQVRF